MATPAKKAKTALKLCPYGSSCYRKNPAHLEEFSHPKSTVDGAGGTIDKQKRPASKASTSTDTSALPPCKYGAKCYRKNILHFAEYSHPTASSSAGNESDSGDTDAYDSEDEKDKKQSSTKDAKDILNRGMSLVKSFTAMTEQERKDLIRQAFEVKQKLKEELEATKKKVEEKEKELNKLQEQMKKGILLVDGEEKALEKDKTVYFTLMPERNYKEGSADQIHFRLAESQFYRLISGEEDLKYRVTKVQYVVTPHLVKRFKAAREVLKKTRGEEMSYPVLGFHGTDENNITPICEKGFRMPGDSGFVEKTDAGWYGAGIYFSEYPSYSMDYIDGAERLLLCQVLPGKVHMCKEIKEGSKLQKGHDSHMSPDLKELVIFNSHHILPCYVVHYTSSPIEDFTYKKVTPGIKRVRKIGGPERQTGSLASQLKKAKKEPVSTIFEGQRIHVIADKQLTALVTKHKGLTGTDTSFDVLVVHDDFDTENSKIVDTALENDKPVVIKEFVYECIFHKKFLDPDYFLHDLYDK